MPKTVYIADDDRSIRELVREYLNKDGYNTEIFADGDQLFAAYLKKQPDMVIIDIMMPGTDGLTVCRKIRAESGIPIIIISARDDEVDRIIGLELGSDDYLSKPFSPRELAVRVRNIFSRLDRAGKTEGENKIRLGDVEINTERRTVRINGIEAEFTGKEFELLSELLSAKDRAFTRDQLIKKIWGYEFIGETRAIDDLVKRIRRKLREAGSAAVIETVWGYGYKAADRGQE